MADEAKDVRTVNKAYFPALDGLRFAAFLLVFFHHVTFYLKEDIYKNIFWIFFRNNGWIGVDVFFVLTGFLITTTLLTEREENNKFSIKNFWVKRILRIWPLYFLALFVGFFVAPFVFSLVFHVPFNLNDTQSLPWYVLFLGNWNVVWHGWGNLRSISQLWAISVDQQFYIILPLLLIFAKKLKISVILDLSIIGLVIILRYILVVLGVGHPGIYTDTVARLDTFTIGILLAQILFYKPDFFDRYKQFCSGFF